MSEETVLIEKKGFVSRWHGMVFFFLLLFTFIGCNTLPIPQNPQDTLLVVPVGNYGKNKQHLRKLTLIVFIDNWDEPLYINCAKDFVIKTDMLPGDYTITKVKAIHSKKEYDVNFPFTLNPGEITICPLTVNIRIVFYYEFFGDPSLFIDWNVLETDAKTYNNVVEEISQMENVELWQVASMN